MSSVKTFGKHKSRIFVFYRLEVNQQILKRRRVHKGMGIIGDYVKVTSGAIQKICTNMHNY